MTIKIIEDEETVLTRSEYERLSHEYNDAMRFTTQPCSFETWLRSRNYASGKDKWVKP